VQLENSADPVWRGLRSRAIEVGADHQLFTYPDTMAAQDRPLLYLVASEVCLASYCNSNAPAFINAKLVDVIPPIYDLNKGYQSMQVSSNFIRSFSNI
jgi:hypothetical protein